MDVQQQQASEPNRSTREHLETIAMASCCAELDETLNTRCPFFARPEAMRFYGPDYRSTTIDYLELSWNQQSSF